MRNRQGFTLIELLVVAAIIAVLMAILMPTLQRVKKQAKIVACQSNLRQWALIWSMYTQDNNGYFPDKVLTWRDVAEKHHKEPKITLCPTATRLYSEGGQIPFGAWGSRDSTGKANASSYGINQWVLNAQSVAGRRTLEYLWRTPNVKGTHEVPLFGDCAITGATPWEVDNPPEYDGHAAMWGSGGNVNEMRRFCMNRHSGHLNALFLDWSVRKVGLKELWTLKWHRQYNTAGPWTKAGGVMPSDWPKWMRRFRDY